MGNAAGKQADCGNGAASTIVLAISGMTCGGCANAVGRALSRVPGVSRASVDLPTERATVTGTAPVEELLRAVEAAGFAGQPSSR